MPSTQSTQMPELLKRVKDMSEDYFKADLIIKLFYYSDDQKYLLNLVLNMKGDDYPRYILKSIFPLLQQKMQDVVLDYIAGLKEDWKQSILIGVIFPKANDEQKDVLFKIANKMQDMSWQAPAYWGMFQHCNDSQKKYIFGELNEMDERNRANTIQKIYKYCTDQEKKHLFKMAIQLSNENEISSTIAEIYKDSPSKCQEVLRKMTDKIKTEYLQAYARKRSGMDEANNSFSSDNVKCTKSYSRKTSCMDQDPFSLN